MEFNIVYFAFVSANYGGVEQKIIAQFDALVKQRPNVTLYFVCSFYPKGMFVSEINKRPNVKVLVNTETKVKNPYFRRKEKFQLVSKVLKEYDPKNTIVYFRHPDSDFLFLDFLKANKEYKFITEHQEVENTFKKSRFNGNYFGFILETFFGRNVRKRLSAFVGVTREISDFEIKKSGEPNKRKITIGNGTDVQKFSVRSLNNEHPETIKLLFVGSGYRRQGLDRIIKGIAIYVNSGEKPYKIILRVAGESRQMNENRKLVKKLKIDEYVEFLGEKNPLELDEHFNWADIGVGNLGFHRVGLKYASNLKTKEYFSRGIPFFESTIDEDLAGSEYFIRADANDSPINMGEIVNLALKIRSDSEHPKIMRNYAMANLDWSIKMKKLILFLESVFNSPQQTYTGI
jgi:glycosyltransferase involved in cell wall biosynthesis